MWKVVGSCGMLWMSKFCSLLARGGRSGKERPRASHLPELSAVGAAATRRDAGEVRRGLELSHLRGEGS